MEWPVALANEAEKEIADADFPDIRLLAVPTTTATEPASEISSAEWLVCSPETISRASPGYPFGFSAVGYYFGRELYRRLGVPIGLINASVGGTCAETWISRDGLLAEPAVREIWENYERDLPSLIERQARWEEEIRAIETPPRLLRTAQILSRAPPAVAPKPEHAPAGPLSTTRWLSLLPASPIMIGFPRHE